MRKVVLFIAASLDGFIARKDGGIDWLFTGGDFGYKKFYALVDTVIMGRKTYDVACGFEKEPFKGKEVIVFSRRKKKGYSKDPVKTTRELLAKKGKDIWLVGGGKIITLLMEAKLINEIIVSVHPIVLGSGIPLFGIVGETKLHLAKTVKFPNGLVQLHYSLKN